MNMDGVIVKAVSSFYYTACNDKIYECKARGNFRKAEVSPVVGDRVLITPTAPDKGVVEKIYERKNLLKRPLIANIDKIFIVSSYKTPAPDTLMIDRMAAIAEFEDIQPVIVFNKSDMGDFSQFFEIYRKAGLKTYTVSAKNGEGIAELKKETENCISAFAGNSGVGKSSILNAIFGELSLKTGEVSEKLGRGRHTTRHTQLFRFDNSLVADTPGFAALEFCNKTELKKNLAFCFPDFADYIQGCKFANCTHTGEPGCRLVSAVKDGNVEQSRYNSYLALYSEIKDSAEWKERR